MNANKYLTAGNHNLHIYLSFCCIIRSQCMEYEELFESIVYKVTNQVRYVVIKKNDNGF